MDEESLGSRVNRIEGFRNCGLEGLSGLGSLRFRITRVKGFRAKGPSGDKGFSSLGSFGLNASCCTWLALLTLLGFVLLWFSWLGLVGMAWIEAHLGQGAHLGLGPKSMTYFGP